MAVYLQAPALLDEYPVRKSPLKLAIHYGSVKDHFRSRIFVIPVISLIAFAKFMLFVPSDYAYDDQHSRVSCALWCVGHIFIIDLKAGGQAEGLLTLKLTPK